MQEFAGAHSVDLEFQSVLEEARRLYSNYLALAQVADLGYAQSLLGDDKADFPDTHSPLTLEIHS